MKARKSKRYEDEVLKFTYNLEANLFSLKEELKTLSYKPSGYKSFFVMNHKRRLVSKSSFRDRIVHHAFINVLEPYFDRKFIYDSYGCRKNKGQHRAVRRFREYSQRNKFVLKLDIQKYYASIDHQILLRILERYVKDEDAMFIIRRILKSGKDILKNEYIMNWFKGDTLISPLNRDRGLPIGNLTSQFFANIYLNNFDHLIKEKLRVKGYIRYMDDMVLFSNDKQELWKHLKRIESYLNNLRLVLKDKSILLQPVSKGTLYLGYRIFPTHILVRKDTVYRYTRKFKNKLKAYKRGELSKEKLIQSWNAWQGHIAHADNYNLQKLILKKVLE